MPSESILISQCYLKIDGGNAPEELARALIEVIVDTSLSLPSVAVIRISDPELKWLDSSLLAFGKSLEISVRASGINSNPGKIFDGEIVEMESLFGNASHELQLRGFDRAHRLARGKHVRTFQNVSDGDVASKMASEVGLQIETDVNSIIHEHIFQRNESNLNFLRRRASALGSLLRVEGKKLIFKMPDSAAEAVELIWGESLNEFRPRITTLEQVEKVTMRGWSPGNAQEVEGNSKKPNGLPEIGFSKLGGDVSKEAFIVESPMLVSGPPAQSQRAAELMATALNSRRAQAFVTAEGRCVGNPKILAGTKLNLQRVGKRFNGDYTVTAAHHHYDARSGYSTSFTLSGHLEQTLLQILRADSNTFQAGMTLMVGIVTDNQDPENLGRVKVKFPRLSATHTSKWTRILTIGAGETRGIEFIPEVNDEVLVGFEMDDPDSPFILGSLWNGKQTPPEKTAQLIKGGKVVRRIIRSRSGHVIELHEDNGIVIRDSKGNVVELNSQKNELTISSKGNLNLKSEGDLALSADGNITIKANRKIRVNGSEIHLN